MQAPWYYIVIFLVGGCLLCWIFDKFQIIKSKPLRYFIVILAYTFIYWGAYDLFLAPQ